MGLVILSRNRNHEETQGCGCDARRKFKSLCWVGDMNRSKETLDPLGEKESSFPSSIILDLCYYG